MNPTPADLARLSTVPSAYAEPTFEAEPETIDLRAGMIVEDTLGIWTYLPQSNGDGRRWVSVDSGTRYRGDTTERLLSQGKSTVLFSGVGPVLDTLIVSAE